MSLSKEHLLITSFLVLCVTFVNATRNGASGKNEQRMDTPEDISQSLQMLNNALVRFDQATLIAPSIRTLSKGLDKFTSIRTLSIDSAPLTIPVEAVYKVQTASDQVSDNMDRSTNALVRWSSFSMRLYTHLESNDEPLSDDKVFEIAQRVVNKGRSEFSAALEFIHTVVNQLKDMQTNLDQVNVRASDMKKTTDFAKMVTFVLQLAEQVTQVGRDLAAELKKVGLISSTVEEEGVSTSIVKGPRGETLNMDDAGVKSKIIQAYLIVCRKTVGDTIESLSKLKVDGSESVAQAEQLSNDGNNEQKGENSRKIIFEAFSQLVATMKLFQSHRLPEEV
uniref:Uncharacterized protein n=1 Tax=Cacopsylla melanoneura TaxID=428564 RepID=A0A8D8ZZG3_9HEMI